MRDVARGHSDALLWLLHFVVRSRSRGRRKSTSAHTVIFKSTKITSFALVVHVTLQMLNHRARTQRHPFTSYMYTSSVRHVGPSQITSHASACLACVASHSRRLCEPRDGWLEFVLRAKHPEGGQISLRCKRRACMQVPWSRERSAHRHVSHVLHHIVGPIASHAIAGSTLCFGLSIQRLRW